MSESPRGSANARRHWTELILHFADGSGLTSTWEPGEGVAIQQGGRSRMDVLAATDEHLRALAELRELGSCTNWFLNAELEPLTRSELKRIEWHDFPGVAAADS